MNATRHEPNDGATPLDPLACPLAGTTLVEASAGTGKTWNLGLLYLRLLLERALPVQQVLVVTFTKAATAELRERLRARIVEALALVRGEPAPEGSPLPALLVALEARGVSRRVMEDRLNLARATFDEAAIFTIHGFCQRALADAPFAAQVPLTTELLESDADLRQQVVNDFWRRRVLGDAQAAALLGLDDTPEMLSRLLQRRLARPLADLRWPDDVGAPPLLALPALQAAHAAARAAWQAGRERIRGTVVAASAQLHANVYKPETIEQAVRDWDLLLQPPDPAPAAIAKADKAALFGERRLGKCTKRGGTPPSDPFFALAQQVLDAAAAVQAQLASHRAALLKALLDDGPARLRRLKRERRVAAFDDLLLNLHERLTDPATPGLADTLRARFPAALVDEFQDTDPLQFAIFHRLYGGRREHPLFLVGDPKQAIYSFRNADLHTYLQARGHADAEHTLADNQRSSAALIQALNTVFTTNPRAFLLPGLAFRPAGVGAKPRATFTDRTAEHRAPLHVWLLPADADGGLPKDAALAAAAQACAAEISRLLQAASRGDVLIDGQRLRAADIAVLVRTHAQGNRVRDALRALGIGSVELSQASVFHTSDAEELERLLAAVLEPTRERLLRAALVTEMLGHDASQVEALADDEAAVAALMLRFAAYRDDWRRAGLAPMLRRLMRDEGVIARLLARPDGERRMTNLLHLAERLHDASAEHRAPAALLRWLSAERQAEHGTEAAQLRLDSDRNLVQIVTVHKAKGLEYPVVFCPYLWDDASPPDRGDGIEYHDDDGTLVIDFRPDAAENGAKRRRDAERAAERLRLAYVALTRAVHRCHVVAGCHGRAGQLTTSARGMLNWLVAGAGRTPGDWFDWRPGAAAPHDIETAWSALAARSNETIAVAPLPRDPGTPLLEPRPDPADIRALPPPATVRPGWRIGSFSAMLQAGAETPSLSAERPVPAADHDADVLAPPAADADADPPAADDVLHFPRGMDAGTCLHAALERADLRDPATWPAAVRAALALHPQPAASADARDRLERMALSMLADVARTPLPTGFALHDVDPARRLHELEFHLPSHGLTAAALSRLLARHGFAVPALAFGRLDGYLNGFIDLVFEHQGRHYVVDWKSNHLGTTPAAYARPALDAAMAAHGYHLQSLLYAVALDRHLAARLPRYDRERHFGGVLYLFVRGMRPGWSSDGQPAGVHFHRPAPELLDAAGALLRGSTKVPA